MWRNILGVLIGFCVGNIAIMGLHYAGMYFYPLPEGVNMNDMEALSAYIAVAPFGALMAVIVAHIGGTFLAGMATNIFSKSVVTAYIIGGIFTLAGLYNIFQLPHPWWFTIELILYVPAAYYGFQSIKAYRNA